MPCLILFEGRILKLHIPYIKKFAEGIMEVTSVFNLKVKGNHVKVVSRALFRKDVTPGAGNSRPE